MQLDIKQSKHCCKLFYVSIYIALCSTDFQQSISLKVLEGNIIRHKILRTVIFNPITTFMKPYAKFKKNIIGFWFKYISRIKF